MSWATWLNPTPSSSPKNTPSKQPVTEPDNSSGLNSNGLMANGSGLTLISLLKRGHNTSTKFTLGPNTITTHTTWIRHPSNGTYSNITTRTISPEKTTTGTLSESDLMSLHPLTLHIQREIKAISLVLWCWALMLAITIIFLR